MLKYLTCIPETTVTSIYAECGELFASGLNVRIEEISADSKELKEIRHKLICISFELERSVIYQSEKDSYNCISLVNKVFSTMWIGADYCLEIGSLRFYPIVNTPDNISIVGDSVNIKFENEKLVLVNTDLFEEVFLEMKESWSDYLLRLNPEYTRIEQCLEISNHHLTKKFKHIPIYPKHTIDLPALPALMKIAQLVDRILIEERLVGEVKTFLLFVVNFLKLAETHFRAESNINIAIYNLKEIQ